MAFIDFTLYNEHATDGNGSTISINTDHVRHVTYKKLGNIDIAVFYMGNDEQKKRVVDEPPGSVRDRILKNT